MRVAAIHQSYDQQAHACRPGRSDDLRLAQGMMWGSILGAFLWGVLAGIAWFCI